MWEAFLTPDPASFFFFHCSLYYYVRDTIAALMAAKTKQKVLLQRLSTFAVRLTVPNLKSNVFVNITTILNINNKIIKK